MRTWNPPLVFILALGLTACSGGSSGSGSGGGSAGSGNFSLRITDAPFPVSFVEEASVEIESVEVRDSNGPWVTVYSTPTVVDLIPLRGGVSRTLVTANLPAGTYDEVRLIVGTSGRVVLDSSAVVAGSTHEFSLANGNLKFPSGMQSGIKVKVDPPIVVSTRLSADLILDFFCRVIQQADARGAAICTPRNTQGVGDGGPFLNLSSGYIQRAIHTLPRQGDRSPWRLYQNYLMDILLMKLRRVDDGALVFTRPSARPRRANEAATAARPAVAG